jgi:hypothetical protein
MSKRRPGLPQRERDDWPTPWPAVAPLLAHLAPKTPFIEPCAGAGELVQHLERAGHVCAGAFDLPIDARVARYATNPGDTFITNVPFRPQFEPHKIIENLSNQRPLWALLYSDWLFTSRAAPYLNRLRKVVVIGRVKWLPDSKFTGGFENACWCLFDKPAPLPMIQFAGRIAKREAA